MTSSTSASERLLQVALAIAGPAVVMAALFVLIARSAGPAADQHVVVQVQAATAGSRVLLLGNSVTASIVPAELAAALGMPADDVSNAALPGAFPAHWIALLGGVGPGTAPELLLVYVPAENLLATDPSDRDTLALLVPGRVSGLSEVALGQPTVLAEVSWNTRRAALRDQLVVGTAVGPMLWLWPGLEAKDMRPALDRKLGRMQARDPDAHGGSLAQGPTGGERQVPVFRSPGSSALPLLVTQAQRLGSRLVVVLPAEMGASEPRCHADDLPPGAAWLLDQGADVVDLRAARLGPASFTTRHHLSAEGGPRLSAALARGLAALGLPGTPADARGRHWAEGCP